MYVNLLIKQNVSKILIRLFSNFIMQLNSVYTIIYAYRHRPGSHQSSVTQLFPVLTTTIITELFVEFCVHPNLTSVNDLF